MFSFGKDSSSKTKSSSSASSKPAPWEAGDPFLRNFYKWAEAAGMREPEYYPYNAVAGTNDFLGSGELETKDSAWKSKAIANDAATYWGNMAAGEDISKNPYLQNLQKAMGASMNAAFGAQSNQMKSQFSAASGDLNTSLKNMYQGHQAYQDVAQRRLQEELLQSTLPRLTARAVGAGNLGGSRGQLAQGRAVGDVGKALADYMIQHESEYGQTGRSGAQALSSLGGQQAAAISGLGGQQAAALGQASSQLNYDAWNKMKSNQLAALQIAPSVQGMQAVAPQMLMNVGDYKRKMEQEQLTGDKERWDYYQNYPANMASLMASWYNSTIPFGSNTTQTSNSSSKSGGGFSFGFGM